MSESRRQKRAAAKALKASIATEVFESPPALPKPPAPNAAQVQQQVPASRNVMQLLGDSSSALQAMRTALNAGVEWYGVALQEAVQNQKKTEQVFTTDDEVDQQATMPSWLLPLPGNEVVAG